MEDERDAEDAIQALDRIEFGRRGRRLRVEWTKQERGDGRRSGSSRSNLRPSKTLFVINFDPQDTRTRDLERHFEPYGKIASVRIRRNFAFVQYEYQEDATRALDATNMSKLMNRVISVEYAARDDDERRDGHGSDRDRRRSPERRRRSPSPYCRERGSPDYNRGGASPYGRVRDSPYYGHSISPVMHHRERTSAENVREPSYRHHEKRSPSRGDCRRNRSRSPSRTPRRDLMASPENGHEISSNSYKRHNDSSERSHSSPCERERDLLDCSCSPYENSKRTGLDEGQVSPQVPEEGEKLSPENGHLPVEFPEAQISTLNPVEAESHPNGPDNSGSSARED
ncbi:hypothetical protein SAY87_008228 [Trapa incisa]|uniref:RRM domain-containing protein n=1 Tax=Trapa incisa TaxID=236973 RepID=A0AAN7KGD5_9MYRT|nr:hypothetical protein SAY87_008228 [Trapa incisa]